MEPSSTQATNQHANTEGSLLALLSPVPIRERHQWTPADDIADAIGLKTPFAPESILTSEERQIIWDSSPPRSDLKYDASLMNPAQQPQVTSSNRAKNWKKTGGAKQPSPSNV
ncbi:uncharacterized protein VTP21DRAFT_5937 [Calcarisporiella thermophila]|uniref:uncharacterized protein n=1 Tax=Calcarisporiella thermophila TaxID=911321 RepID=UPI0037439B0C